MEITNKVPANASTIVFLLPAKMFKVKFFFMFRRLNDYFV
jgi:hypothetical protein